MWRSFTDTRPLSTRLVDELLEVTRVTHGTIRLRKQAVSINDVLRTALESVRPSFKLKHQTINGNLSDETLMVDADPLRLSQAFGNISGERRAVLARRLGGKRCRRGGKDEVIVRISDQGLGIAARRLAACLRSLHARKSLVRRR